MEKRNKLISFTLVLVIIFITIYVVLINKGEALSKKYVTFVDGFDNTMLSKDYLKEGKEILPPIVPKREDMLFIGWYEGENKISDFTAINKNLNLVAKYALDVNNNGIPDNEDTYHKVIFYDTVSKEIIDEVKVLTLMDVKAPKIKSYLNKVFTGWSKSLENITEDTTIEALYKYNKDSGSKSDSTFKEVDTERPSKPIITARDNYIRGTWTNKTVILDFESSDNVTPANKLIYEYTTSPSYKDSWKEISNPYVIENDRYNNIYVRAIDEAGNISDNSDFFQVKVDKTPPSKPVIINSSNQNVTNKDVTVTFTSSDARSGISHYEYSYDNKVFTKINDESLVFTENQKKNIYIRAVDNAGNKSASTSTLINIDKDVIKVTKVLNNGKETPAKDTFVLKRPRITVTAKEGLSDLRYIWTTSLDKPSDNDININANVVSDDNVNFVNYPQNITDFTSKPNGLYYLWYRAEDSLGNVIYYRTNSFLLDNKAPKKPTITAEDNYVSGTWTKDTVTLTFDTTDNYSENLIYEYNTSPVHHPDAWRVVPKIMVFDQNVHNNVYVRAIDEAGNISDYAGPFNVKVDKTIPKVPKVDLFGYESGTITKDNVTLKPYGSLELNNDGAQIANESKIKYQYKYLNEEEWKDYSSLIFKESIDTKIFFRTIDEAGNASDKTKAIHIIVDKIKPTGEVTYTKVGKGNVLATLEISEEIKQLDGWDSIGNNIYTKLYFENITEEIKFEDLAGNIGFVNIEINNINPGVINTTYNTKEKSRYVNVTIEFNEPVRIKSDGLWIPSTVSLYSNKWTTTYIKNISSEINFENKFGKKSSTNIEINNIDRTLNKAKITQELSSDKKSVVVTLTSDEPLATVKSLKGNWSKQDDEGYVWTKTYTKNTLDAVTYVDIAGNIRISNIIITNLRWF